MTPFFPLHNKTTTTPRNSKNGVRVSSRTIAEALAAGLFAYALQRLAELML